MNHSMPGLPVHHQLPEFTQGRNTGGDGVRPTKVRHAVVAPAVSTHAQAIGEGRQAQPVPPMPSAGREPEGSSAALDRLTISRFPHQPHMGHHSWERKGNDPGTVTTLAKVPQCHQASEDPGDPLRDPTCPHCPPSHVPSQIQSLNLPYLTVSLAVWKDFHG